MWAIYYVIPLQALHRGSGIESWLALIETSTKPLIKRLETQKVMNWWLQSHPCGNFSYAIDISCDIRYQALSLTSGFGGLGTWLTQLLTVIIHSTVTPISHAPGCSSLHCQLNALLCILMPCLSSLNIHSPHFKLNLILTPAMHTHATPVHTTYTHAPHSTLMPHLSTFTCIPHIYVYTCTAGMLLMHSFTYNTSIHV